MHQRWANWSLRVQLSLAVMLIMVVLLMLFSGMLFIAVRSFMLEQTAAQLSARARVLLGDSAEPPATHEPWTRMPTAPLSEAKRAELQAIVDALTNDDTSVVVYEADGEVALRGAITSGDRSFYRPFGPRRFAVPPIPPIPPVPPKPDDWAFEQVLQTESQVRYTSHRGLDQQLAVLVPIYDNEKLVGVIQLATPLRQIYMLLRWLGLALGGGTILTVMTALVLSLWATRTILNPLWRVIKTSQRVGQGDLNARTELRNSNEIGVLGATFDQMVAQLQASFATQRRFIADAAHELRTPLTAVSGNVELLMLGAASDPAQQRRSLQHMNRELERMGRLVDDLLTLSRLDACSTLRYADVDLGTLAQEMVGEFHSRSPQHQWLVQAPAGVVVRGDADRLRQVLLNVLENARKYTPEGGCITVSVTSEQDRAVLSIVDTGIGIPADDAQHVWDRFYRVDQARTRARGGSGLGLSIVKSIIETHGGHVALHSTIGQGTTVTLSLPR
jgi:two-component system OmpR family sensor kinase